MDSEHLLVPNNSRICNTPGDECSEARNSPIPTSFTSISFESRLSSTPSIKQYGSSPFQKFKRHCNTPATTFDHDQAAAEKLKSRLYDRVENSDVYRRQVSV